MSDTKPKDFFLAGNFCNEDGLFGKISKSSTCYKLPPDPRNNTHCGNEDNRLGSHWEIFAS